MKNILFDFNNLTEKARGIKTIADRFKKDGLAVIEFAVGPIKRAAGVSFKEVTFTFSDSQIAAFRVKQTGDIYQVLINGKLTPVKNQDNHSDAIDEIAGKLVSGRDAFQRKLAAAKMPLPAGVKSTAPKLQAELENRKADLLEAIEQFKASGKAGQSAYVMSATVPVQAAFQAGDYWKLIVLAHTSEGYDGLRAIFGGETPEEIRARVRAWKKADSIEDRFLERIIELGASKLPAKPGTVAKIKKTAVDKFSASMKRSAGNPVYQAVMELLAVPGATISAGHDEVTKWLQRNFPSNTFDALVFDASTEDDEDSDDYLELDDPEEDQADDEAAAESDEAESADEDDSEPDDSDESLVSADEKGADDNTEKSDDLPPDAPADDHAYEPSDSESEAESTEESDEKTDVEMDDASEKTDGSNDQPE